jgi:5'(3')-deoxyribonucleotidase
MKPILFLDMDGVIVQALPWDVYLSRKGSITFWKGLKKTEWADELVALCCRLFRVVILTSPISSQCLAGKAEWLGQHYPWLVDDAIFTRCKSLLASPGRVLIDDNHSNCQDFEFGGGIAYQAPNPDHDPSIQRLVINQVMTNLMELVPDE